MRGGDGGVCGVGDAIGVVRGRVSEFGEGLGVCAWAKASAIAMTTNDPARELLFINKY